MRRPFAYCYRPGLFWFRIFGHGLHIKDTGRHRLLYSERNCHTTFWAIRRLR